MLGKVMKLFALLALAMVLMAVTCTADEGLSGEGALNGTLGPVVGQVSGEGGLGPGGR